MTDTNEEVLVSDDIDNMGASPLVPALLELANSLVVDRIELLLDSDDVVNMSSVMLVL